MPDSSRTTGVVRFGSYEADIAGAELRKNGRRIKLQDRPFDILRLLLERPGEVVTREEFRKRLWPADTFVDFDHSLNSSINNLRQALNDDSENPRFVAAVGRRGYKFVAPLQATETLRLLQPEPKPSAAPAGEGIPAVPEGVPSPAAPLPKPQVLHLRWGWRAFSLVAAAAVILLVWAWSAGRWPESLRRKARDLVGEDSNTAAAAIKPRRSFAVFGLKNLSGRPDEA